MAIGSTTVVGGTMNVSGVDPVPATNGEVMGTGPVAPPPVRGTGTGTGTGTTGATSLCAGSSSTAGSMCTSGKALRWIFADNLASFLGIGIFATNCAGFCCVQPLRAAKRKKALMADNLRLIVAGGVWAIFSQRLKASMLSVVIRRSASAGESVRGAAADCCDSQNQEKNAVKSLL